MKNITSTLLIVIVVSLFVNCSDNADNNPVSGSEPCPQIFVVWAETSDSYWDRIKEEEIFQPFTDLSGMVLSNELLAFNYYQIGETQVTKCFEYFPGGISFGSSTNSEYEPLPGHITPLKFEGKTSAGIVSGSISLPDTIQTVTLSHSEKIELGQSFTISWSGSNADFFELDAYYCWNDSNKNSNSYKYVDPFIAGNSFTFDDSLLVHNGNIHISYIVPINGPVPTAGSKANMIGDGSGFLYYSVKRYDVRTTIQVGMGLVEPPTTLSSNKEPLPKTGTTYSKILKGLGFPIQQ